MCNKKYLKLLVQRSILNLKNLKFLFFVPVLLMDIVLPMLLINSYKNNCTGENFLVDIRQYCFMILPASALCWSVFSMKDYVGETGAEILYISNNKVKIMDFAVLLFYSFLNIFVIATVVCNVVPAAIPVFIAVALVTVLLFGVSYFLLYCTKSLTVVIMFDLLYIVISLILGGQHIIFPFYVTNQITYSNLTGFYLPLGIIGIFFCAIGVRKNKYSCI